MQLWENIDFRILAIVLYLVDMAFIYTNDALRRKATQKYIELFLSTCHIYTLNPHIVRIK